MSPNTKCKEYKKFFFHSQEASLCIKSLENIGRRILEMNLVMAGCHSHAASPLEIIGLSGANRREVGDDNNVAGLFGNNGLALLLYRLHATLECRVNGSIS